MPLKAISPSPNDSYCMKDVDHASEGQPYLCDTFETKPEVQVRPGIPVIRCRSDSAVESIAIVPSSMYA